MKFLLAAAFVVGSYAGDCPVGVKDAVDLVNTLSTLPDTYLCAAQAAFGLLRPDDICTGPCSNVFDSATALSLETGAKFVDCSAGFVSIPEASKWVARTLDTVIAEKTSFCESSTLDKLCFVSTVDFDLTDGLHFDSEQCKNQFHAMACEVTDSRCQAKTVECDSKNVAIYKDKLMAVFDCSGDDCASKAADVVALMTLGMESNGVYGICAFDGINALQDELAREMKEQIVDAAEEFAIGGNLEVPEAVKSKANLLKILKEDNAVYQLTTTYNVNSTAVAERTSALKAELDETPSPAPGASGAASLCVSLAFVVPFALLV